MILNLSKGFQFNRESKEYHVNYLFTRPTTANSVANGNICLTLDITVDNMNAETRQLSKPTSMLYQSNEMIEKLIEEEVVSFSENDAVQNA